MTAYHMLRKTFADTNTYCGHKVLIVSVTLLKQKHMFKAGNETHFSKCRELLV